MDCLASTRVSAIPASLWQELRRHGMYCLPRKPIGAIDDDAVFQLPDRQQQAVAEMKACQIMQTGYAGSGRRATQEEKEWAAWCWQESQQRNATERVPGTCSGCNSAPCRCLA